MKLDNPGFCCLCGEKLKNSEYYMHYECACLASEANMKRVKEIIKKYGEGLRGQNALLRSIDLPDDVRHPEESNESSYPS